MIVAADRPPPIVITGPGGWIGTAMLAYLAERRGSGWSHNVRLFGSHERLLTAPDGTVLPVRALESIDGDAVEGADVIHLAYLTKEKVDAVGASQFLENNFRIDALLTAALTAGRASSLFVASSGAAHLAETGRDRHLYGVSKLLQEDHFLSLGAKQALPVFVGRIFNLAGPHINKLDSYAISSFLVQAIERQSITIEAAVPVFRAYLHIYDLCGLILGALGRKISPGRAIDLSGDLVVEMSDLALHVAAATGLPSSAIGRGNIEFSQPSTYLGKPSDTKMLAMMCDRQLAPFEQQVADTAAFVRDYLSSTQR